MKPILPISFFLFLLQSIHVYSQDNVKIILTATEAVDGTNIKWGRHRYEERFVSNQIVYYLDTAGNTLKTRSYQIKNYHSALKEDSLMIVGKSRKNKRWVNQVELSVFDSLFFLLNKDDTTIREYSFLHTSHHYIHFYITLIRDEDTFEYAKTKPFDASSVWVRQGEKELFAIHQ